MARSIFLFLVAGCCLGGLAVRAQDAMTPPSPTPVVPAVPPAADQTVPAPATGTPAVVPPPVDGTVAPATAPAPATTKGLFEPVGKYAVLDSRIDKFDAAPMIIEASNYKVQPDGSYEVMLPAGVDVPAVIYLQVDGAWIAPAGAETEEIPSGQIKLVQVQGMVSARLPGAAGDFQPATEGQLFPLGTALKTGDGGTAGVLLPGNQSVRLAPASALSIQQTAEGPLLKTVVTLEQGAVFSKIGKWKDGVSDFRVKTPNAVSAAKGTEFVTFWQDNKTITCAVTGTVEVTDAAGVQPTATLADIPSGTVAFRSVPSLKELDYAQVVSGMFDIIQTVNVTAATKSDLAAISYYIPVHVKGAAQPQDWIQKVNQPAWPLPTPTPVPAPPAAPAPVVETSSGNALLYAGIGAAAVALGAGAFFFLRRRK